MTSPYDFLIIGSGVFGTSTAYYLSKAHPTSKIAMLDRSSSFPCPLAASHDFNKIIRADYGNAFYCKLALEAMESWVRDPVYHDFFHMSGMVVLDDTGLGKKIVANYEDLGVHDGGIVSVNEFLEGNFGGRFEGALFKGADWRGVKEVFVNVRSGWAEATKAVSKVVAAALEAGVESLDGDVERLLFDENGGCVGAKTMDGREILAKKVILSTGAGTAKLLADSAPERADIQSGDRITAAAVVTGVVKLSPEQMETFGKAPNFIHSVGEVLGEVLAPTTDGILKFCVDVSFKNTCLHEKSGQMISAPPNEPDQAQHTIPQKLKDECARVVNGIYGKELGEFEFDSFRICWDGITPNQDFIISPHPRCKNLYIATGGSFHGWKFLPILGKYIVQMLDGTLEDDLVKRWSWDREQTGSAHETVMPRRELKDLL